MVSNHTLKLIDFGTATYFEETKDRKHLVGTKGYAAPEQYRRGNIDERCDVYGIGMLLFYLVTGITFDSTIKTFKNIDEVENCSKKLKSIINRCLKFHPSHRYRSVLQLYNKLSEIGQENEPIYLLKSEKSLKLSIAGSQHRIGTTHTSLLIASYINKYIANSIYIEENNNRVVKSIINRNKKIKVKKEVYTLHDCNMTKGVGIDSSVLANYQIIVKDYGVLTQDNLVDFLRGDIRLLILGAKEWELSDSEKVLNEVMEYKEIIYLFNYVDGKMFREAVHCMNGNSCCRIPYIVNPLKATHNESIYELMEEVLRNSFYRKKNTKISRFIHKWLQMKGS